MFKLCFIIDCLICNNLFIFRNKIKRIRLKTNLIWIFWWVCAFLLHIAFKKKKFYIILDLCFSLSIYWLFVVCYTPMKTLHFNSIKLNQHGLFSDFVVTISSRIDHEEIVYETTFTKTKWMHIKALQSSYLNIYRVSYNILSSSSAL